MPGGSREANSQSVLHRTIPTAVLSFRSAGHLFQLARLDIVHIAVDEDAGGNQRVSLDPFNVCQHADVLVANGQPLDVVALVRTGPLANVLEALRGQGRS